MIESILQMFSILAFLGTIFTLGFLLGMYVGKLQSELDKEKKEDENHE